MNKIEIERQYYDRALIARGIQMVVVEGFTRKHTVSMLKLPNPSTLGNWIADYKKGLRDIEVRRLKNGKPLVQTVPENLALQAQTMPPSAPDPAPAPGVTQAPPPAAPKPPQGVLNVGSEILKLTVDRKRTILSSLRLLRHEIYDLNVKIKEVIDTVTL